MTYLPIFAVIAVAAILCLGLWNMMRGGSASQIGRAHV